MHDQRSLLYLAQQIAQADIVIVRAIPSQITDELIERWRIQCQRLAMIDDDDCLTLQ